MSRNNGAAHQYDAYYDAYEEMESYYWANEYQSAPKPQKKRKKKSVRHRIRRLLGITYVRVVCYLVIYGIIMVFLCAKGSMLNYDIVHLQSDIEMLETDNKRLAFEIQEKSSLDRIAEIATTQLGMVKPDMAKAYITDNIQPAQISMPETPIEEEDNETALQKLLVLLKGWANKAIQSGIDLLASY